MVSVYHIVIVTKSFIILHADVDNFHKRSTRLDTTRLGRWSTENCGRNWNSTILPNGICTNQNPSKKMRRLKFPKIWDSTNHLIPVKRPYLLIINKKKGHSRGFHRFSEPQNAIKRKRELRQWLGSWQRTEKAVQYESGRDNNCSLSPRKRLRGRIESI